MIIATSYAPECVAWFQRREAERRTQAVQDDIQARQNAAIAANIDFTHLFDSARAPNWFDARCWICESYTTGSESAVEEWANDHVLICNADKPPMTPEVHPTR